MSFSEKPQTNLKMHLELLLVTFTYIRFIESHTDKTTINYNFAKCQQFNVMKNGNRN